MLTDQIDAAFASMSACRERVPVLRDLYAAGSREQAALDEVLASLLRAYDVLLDFTARAPGERPGVCLRLASAGDRPDAVSG